MPRSQIGTIAFDQGTRTPELLQLKSAFVPFSREGVDGEGHSAIGGRGTPVEWILRSWFDDDDAAGDAIAEVHALQATIQTVYDDWSRKYENIRVEQTGVAQRRPVYADDGAGGTARRIQVTWQIILRRVADDPE